MKFTEHKDPMLNMVRKITPDTIWVNEHPLTKSFYMSQRHLKTDWPVQHIEALTTAHLEALLTLSPELIILGTGETQVFLPPALMAHIQGKGIGLEIMSNDAACRTWNVLTTEDRPVVLGIILP